MVDGLVIRVSFFILTEEGVSEREAIKKELKKICEAIEKNDEDAIEHYFVREILH
jgi:hypothetical protein